MLKLTENLPLEKKWFHFFKPHKKVQLYSLIGMILSIDLKLRSKLYIYYKSIT